MGQGCVIQVTGGKAAATAEQLARRLIELGARAERVDDALAQRVGGPDGAALVCGLLVRNGVLVVVTASNLVLDGAVTVAVAPQDSPAFAAEKILDTLAAEGLVSLESAALSPEEEHLVRERLAALGYIE